MGKKTQKTMKWASPVEVSDVDQAFSAKVIGRLLPPMSDIPKDFHLDSNKWCDKASSLFFSGGTIDLKPEINRQAAFRQLKACLGSFEPKHEHKTAGVAYLLSLWCNSPA